MSASSSRTCSWSAGERAVPALDSTHWKCSISSAASMAMDMDRFLGLWNWRQSRWSMKAWTSRRRSARTVVLSHIVALLAWIVGTGEVLANFILSLCQGVDFRYVFGYDAWLGGSITSEGSHRKELRLHRGGIYNASYFTPAV